MTEPPLTSCVRRLGVLAALLVPLALSMPLRATPAEGKVPALGFMVNPLEPALSLLVNDLAVVSPIFLIGDGRSACVLNPQGYLQRDGRVGGAGALVGFRIFSRRRFDGFYLGVRFGGGVGNHAFKAFLGQLDTGWVWARRAFRIGLGINAGGGYRANDRDRGSLYLFGLDLSLGFAVGRFGGSP